MLHSTSAPVSWADVPAGTVVWVPASEYESLPIGGAPCAPVWTDGLAELDRLDLDFRFYDDARLAWCGMLVIRGPAMTIEDDTSWSDSDTSPPGQLLHPSQMPEPMDL